MIFLSLEDFYEKAAACTRLSREEEIECARQMANGAPDARERLLQSYLPSVAAHMKRTKPHMQTLALAIYCCQALENCVDRFDFLQESETFSHRLSWYLRQATVTYIAER